MKKTIALSALLLAACLPVFAQNIVNPQVGNPENQNTTIAKIETNNQFTIITFDYSGDADNSWVQVNKEIYLQTDQGNEHYNFVKAENIAVAPAKTTIAKAGEKTSFKIYFKKVPQTAKSIDIVERAGYMGASVNFFNFYGVSLTNAIPAGTTQRVKITDVVLMPPPPVEQNGAITSFTQQPEGMQNAMNSMEPMYKTMIKAMMDAQLAYFNQPGKTEEIAKLNKQYFDALVKQGFTTDQALKITISSGIIPKTAGVNQNGQ
jgi:hypothetical protein